MTCLYWAHHIISRLWWHFFFFYDFRFITLHQGISWAKKKYHDYEETVNKRRQLQKVQTQTGSRGSTTRADKEEGQESTAKCPQWRSCWWWQFFFPPSIELSAVWHRDLPCGNEAPNKMHNKFLNRCTVIFVMWCVCVGVCGCVLS